MRRNWLKFGKLQKCIGIAEIRVADKCGVAVIVKNIDLD